MNKQFINISGKSVRILPFLLFSIFAVVIYSLIISNVRLPSGRKPTFIYRTGGIANGDGVIAWKGPCSISDYQKFVLLQRLDRIDSANTLLLGSRNSKHDVPDSNWDEPEDPELRYYKRFERRFVRCTYDDGIIYYFERSW